MKHVCIVSSAHPWDDVRVASRIAATLLEAGCRVTWVGPDRTFSSTLDARLSDVDYRLFPPGRGRIARLVGAPRAERLAREVRDVDWWYSPDPDMAARLPKLASSNGGRTVFDVHESYHGGLLERWFPGKPPQFVRKLIRRKIAQVCSKSDLVIGVSDRVLEPYCQGHRNVVVIRNLAPTWLAPERTQGESASGVRMRVLHGKLGAKNGSSQVAAAVSLLRADVQSRVSVVMLEVSSTTEAARNEIRQVAGDLQAEALVVQPGLPHEQMADLMATCSVGLIAYQRDLGYESLPNRLFEYMAAGLAILAPSYSPEIVKILEAEDVGLSADFERPSEIADAIAWCVENPEQVAAMGERARRAYRERYTWEHEAERLLAAMARQDPE